MTIERIRTAILSAIAFVALAFLMLFPTIWGAVECLAKIPASIARMKAFLQRAVCRFRPSYSGGIHMAAVAV